MALRNKLKNFSANKCHHNVTSFSVIVSSWYR